MGAIMVTLGLSLEDMWYEKRFKDLDEVMRALCSRDTRLPDGQPEMLVFESTFSRLTSEKRDWRKIGAKLIEWRSQSRDSAAQAFAEIMYWRSYAWHGRGGNYANKVPPEAWELFHERMGKAFERLEESKALAGNCPLWHSLKLKTLIEAGAPRAKVESVYAEAVKAFPASQQIHFAMSFSMDRKWGGKPGDFDRFARRALNLSKGSEGNTIYARLFWYDDCDCDEAITFGRAGDPDWKLMKAGFEDLLQRYPDQVYNRNKFASFACRANDPATYIKLRQELGDNIVDHLWQSSWNVDVCDRRMGKKS